MTTLNDIGERRAIARILPRLPSRADVRVGAGDDCAVVRSGGPDDWLLTADPVIEGIHFDRAAPPRSVGRKAVGRVLSDIAAMGGEPCWLLLDVAAPGSTPVSVLDALYEGAAGLAADCGAAIVGGDMSAAPLLEIHAFGMGRVPAGRAVCRTGARPGDRLYVTGALGGSTHGRHLTFAPRVPEGRWLRDWATAMIDLSDGLATDLRRLAEASRAGAMLDGPRVPAAPEAAAATDGRGALEHALTDGEDFELLFAVPHDRADAFETAWRARFETALSRIGRILPASEGLHLADASGDTVPLRDTGFDHWRTQRPESVFPHLPGDPA
ncbi:MAG: thiamine-monophosphate kinase [Lentisphaerae bacterium]|nr:thiamine-monophosphate kinase [Lentisphaerota bacterium]